METLVRCGKEASLKELFEAFYGRTYAAVVVVVKNREQAEDITQEAFIRAFLKLKSLREPAKFGSWIATIGTNMARDAIRREKKYVLTGEPVEEDLSIAKTLGVEEEVIRKDDKNRLLKVMRSLSPEHYQVILLFYFHDQKIEDIAVLLNIEEGTVKSRLHRARERLKILLPEKEQNAE